MDNMEPGFTTCTICHRLVRTEHVDAAGVCIGHLESGGHIPTEAEWSDIGRKGINEDSSC